MPWLVSRKPGKHGYALHLTFSARRQYQHRKVPNTIDPEPSERSGARVATKVENTLTTLTAVAA